MSTPNGFAHIVGANFVTVMIGTTTHCVRPDNHPNYQAIREAVRKHDWDSVEQLINVSQAVNTFGKGNVVVVNGQVYYNNQPLHNSIVTRIVNMMNEGFSADPLIKFLENLMENPSSSAVNELYEFLEKNSLPITEDGHFLAYKKVRNDYLDFYTGRVDHSIGAKPAMNRNQVDDNRNNTCSYGLHFCSLEYLPSYHGGQGRVVIVKINPRDVVSIPTDYNYSKGRACTYEVVAEHEYDERTEAFTRSVHASDAGPYHQGQDLDDYDIGFNDGYSDRMQDNDYAEDAFADNPDDKTNIAYINGYRDGWQQADEDLASDKESLDSDHDYDDTEDTEEYSSVETNMSAAVWDDPVVEDAETAVFNTGQYAGTEDAASGRAYGTTVNGYSIQVSPTAYWRGYATGWNAVKTAKKNR